MTVDLLPGDVLLTRSAGLVGWLIRFGERIRCQGWWRTLLWLAKRLVGVAQPDRPGDAWFVNHAAVTVGGGLIVEALAGGLTLSSIGKYPDPVIVRLADLLPDVTDRDRARVVRFAELELSRHDSYGWLSICSIILQLVTPVRLDVSWDGAMVCSAFAGQCLEHAGVVLPTRSSLTTMPSDLASMRPKTGLGLSA